jgi:hypothetical protein
VDFKSILLKNKIKLKNKMKRENKFKLQHCWLFLLIGFFLISPVFAEEINYSYSYSFDGVQITSLKYEPYPVNPGEYFEIWVQARLGNKDYAKFELIEEFPFSLDNNEEAVREYENAENEKIVMRFKVRVDEDAVEGSNELKIGYTSDKYSEVSVIKPLEISVVGSQTSFDAVIQESTTSEVSIAIANIGKYTANSVVVRIPEQESFKATGTDGQMVGNLDSGDYTIVSFSVSAIMQRNPQDTNPNEEMKKEFNSENKNSNLKFEIYYTDELGERRIVNMELPLQMTSAVTGVEGEMPEGFGGGRGNNNQTSFWSSGYIKGAIIFIVLILFFVLYRKYPKQIKGFCNRLKQKIKELLIKKKSTNNSEIPDWIKNDRKKK